VLGRSTGDLLDLFHPTPLVRPSLT
jgi:hypothetical protein